MFENVDRRTTDVGVIGILIALDGTLGSVDLINCKLTEIYYELKEPCALRGYFGPCTRLKNKNCFSPNSS